MRIRKDILNDIAYSLYLKAANDPIMLIEEFITRGNNQSDEFNKSYQNYIALATVEHNKQITDSINQGNL